MERFSREEAQGAQPAEAVPQQALRQFETRDGKPVVRYFVSYARKDKRLKENLLERLRERFACSAEFVFETWEDGDILPGEPWEREIERAIDRCEFGLLLVSHSFLASRYITAKELPKFVPREDGEPVAWRRAVPVGLKKIPFDGSVDLKGLGPLQLFLDDGRFFSERGVDTTRDAFADELFQRILAERAKRLPGRRRAPERPGRGNSARRRLARDGGGERGTSLAGRSSYSGSAAHAAIGQPMPPVRISVFPIP